MFQTSIRIVAKILYFIIPIDMYLSSLFVKMSIFTVIMLCSLKEAMMSMSQCSSSPYTSLNTAGQVQCTYFRALKAVH